MMGMIVEIADVFSERFVNFPRQDQKKIAEFIHHVQQDGLTKLRGKLTRSTNVPGQDPEFQTKYEYARAHYLWHYHIGIPMFVPSRNHMSPYMTSEYVLHFQRFPGDQVIRILDLDHHDPMTLPAEPYLVFTPSKSK